MSKKVTRYGLLPTQYKYLFDIPENAFSLIDDDGTPMLYQDIALYQGGFGSGKTFCGSLRGLLFAFKWAGCKGLVTAKTQDLLDETTKAKYVDHLENMGMKEGVHWWFENRKTTMKFLNGSSILFKTAADHESFRSMEFTFIELEEASLLEEGLFLELIGRLRQMKRDDWEDYYRSIFLHTNPQGRRGWIYKRFINPKTRTKSYRFVIAPTTENHFLGKEYVNAMKEAYSEEQLLELIEGLDVDYDNTVAFPQFREDNIIENIEVDRQRPLVLACDFNYTPMCWYLMQEKNGVWYILKELIEQNVTTKDMCRRVQPIIDNMGIRNLIIMGDAHGADRKTNGSDYSVMIPYFNDIGYDVSLRIAKSNPPIKERLSMLRGMIRNANGEKKVFVDSSCTHLIYNFEESTNNLGNGGLRVPTDTEIQNDKNKLFLIHPIDAISYPMYYLSRMRQALGDEAELF